LVQRSMAALLVTSLSHQHTENPARMLIPVPGCPLQAFPIPIAPAPGPGPVVPGRS
jgi:hypothetical protein